MFFQRGLIISGLLCLLCAEVAPALAAKINIENDSHIRFFYAERPQPVLQLIADNAPLDQVLRVIAVKSKVILHTVALPEATVSAVCLEADLTRLLHCLLGEQASIAMRFEQADKGFSSDAVPAEIWLLSLDNLSESAWRKTGLEATLTPAQPLADTAVPEPSAQERIKILLQQIESGVQKTQALALLATERCAGDCKNDKRLRQVLKTALVDENPAVRAQAVFALAKLSDASANAELMLALRDDNAEVRLMVIENSNNDLTLLQAASLDADVNVRGQALQKLQQLNK